MTSSTDFNPAYVLIRSGTVISSFKEGANGIERLDHEIGTFRFFVSVVEDDGGELGLWSGPSYEEAIRQAEDARSGFEITEAVHDEVAEKWA